MTVKTTIFTHRPRVLPARFSFCVWRPNRLLMTSQWPDNCDAITWIAISNSSDIVFIHGDIHGWSIFRYTFLEYVCLHRRMTKMAWNVHNTSLYSYLDLWDHQINQEMLMCIKNALKLRTNSDNRLMSWRRWIYGVILCYWYTKCLN